MDRTQALLATMIGVQIAGFALLWWKPADERLPIALTAPPIDPASIQVAVKPSDEAALRSAVREVLRQEMRAQGPAPGHASTAASVAEARPASAPAAIQQSNQIVDRALAAGVWTDADNQALLRVAPQLSQGDRIALVDKLFGAINRQQLKPAGALPSL